MHGGQGAHGITFVSFLLTVQLFRHLGNAEFINKQMQIKNGTLHIVRLDKQEHTDLKECVQCTLSLYRWLCLEHCVGELPYS